MAALGWSASGAVSDGSHQWPPLPPLVLTDGSVEGSGNGGSRWPCNITSVHYAGVRRDRRDEQANDELS